jgi:hypothetical protein
MTNSPAVVFQITVMPNAFPGISFMYSEKSKFDSELCHYAPRCLIYPITTQITATINAIANFVNEPLYSLVGWSMQ